MAGGELELDTSRGDFFGEFLKNKKPPPGRTPPCGCEGPLRKRVRICKWWNVDGQSCPVSQVVKLMKR